MSEAARDPRWEPFGAAGERCWRCGDACWWSAPDGRSWHPECYLRRGAETGEDRGHELREEEWVVGGHGTQTPYYAGPLGDAGISREAERTRREYGDQGEEEGALRRVEASRSGGGMGQHLNYTSGVGPKIKELRRFLGLSQVDLAGLMGVTGRFGDVAISQLERNKVAKPVRYQQALAALRAYAASRKVDISRFNGDVLIEALDRGELAPARAPAAPPTIMVPPAAEDAVEVALEPRPEREEPGEELKRLREGVGMTREALASAVGNPRLAPRIAEVEAGKPVHGPFLDRLRGAIEDEAQRHDLDLIGPASADRIAEARSGSGAVLAPNGSPAPWDAVSDGRKNGGRHPESRSAPRPATTGRFAIYGLLLDAAARCGAPVLAVHLARLADAMLERRVELTEALIHGRGKEAHDGRA